jgi:hypothetical protein
LAVGLVVAFCIVGFGVALEAVPRDGLGVALGVILLEGLGVALGVVL